MADLDSMIITSFEITESFTIKIVFKSGKINVINFEPVIGKGWMKQLADQNYFSRVKLNDGGNLEWPDGQDFNPEALYDWEKFEAIYIADAAKQ